MVDGFDAEHLLNAPLVKAMAEARSRFEEGELYLSEMLVPAQNLPLVLGRLQSTLVTQEVSPRGSLFIGPVRGSLHGTGRNPVGMTHEGAGFEVVALGIDMPAHAFVQAVRDHAPDILGLSAFLTTTFPCIHATMEALCQGGVRGPVKVLATGTVVSAGAAVQVRECGLALDAHRAVGWRHPCFLPRQASALEPNL